MRHLTVQESLIKSGQACKLCNSQRKFEVDREHPLQYFRQPNYQGMKAYVLAYPPKYSDDGLCYYCQKKKKGLFDTEKLYNLIKEEACNRLRQMGIGERGHGRR